MKNFNFKTLGAFSYLIFFLFITFNLLQCSTAGGGGTTVVQNVCKENEDLINSSCVTKCESGQTRNNEGKCVPVICKEYEEQLGPVCVLKCFNNQIRNNAGICINTYNLTIDFNDAGVTTNYTTVFAYGTTINNENLPQPKREGFAFLNWLSNGVAITLPFNIPASNFTLIANWSSVRYNLTFNSNLIGATPVSIQAFYKTIFTLTNQSFTNPGFILEGWSNVAGGTNIIWGLDTIFNIPSHDTQFFAVWSTNSIKDRIADKDGNGLIEIYTVEDLNNVRFNLFGTSWKTSSSASEVGNSKGCPLTGCNGYELKANLDFNSDETGKPTRWSTNYVGNVDGWDPIGSCGDDDDCYDTSDNRPFAATFNGNGFEIRNLYIKNKKRNAGLFSSFSSNTFISNLGLTNIKINFISDRIGYFSYVGGLVGFNYQGSIINSYVTGDINLTNTVSNTIMFIGGLVGYQLKGVVNASHTNSNITVISTITETDFLYIGGLIGSLNDSDNNYTIPGNVSNSYATGNINAKCICQSEIGGLIGAGAVQIDNSYAKGSINLTSPISQVGGLIGWLKATYPGNTLSKIENSHATGEVYVNSTPPRGSDTQVGGLIGNISERNLVKNSYATGNVNFTSESPSRIGGLIGFSNEIVEIRNNYYMGRITSSNSNVDSKVGGLIGLIYKDGAIDKSYAIGMILSSSQNIGGIIGSGSANNSYAAVYTYSPTGIQKPIIGATILGNSNSSYWDKDVSKIYTLNDGIGGTGLTTEQMQANSGTYPINLGSESFHFTRNSYPKLCADELKAGRTKCTTQDYLPGQ